MSATDRELISLAKAAKRSGCSPRTIRRYIATGRLTGYRLGPRLIRIDPDELAGLVRPIPNASVS